MRRTKIVCTIGPASESRETLIELIRAGLNVARLNLSHGTREEHASRLKTIRQAARETGEYVAIMLDLKGPEIRIGTFPGGKIRLEDGDLFTFSTRPGAGSQESVSVEHPGLTRDVEPGAHLLLDDGNIVMEALEVGETTVKCRVLAGGTLADRKKINLPGMKVSLPALSEKDVEDIRFGAREGVDFIAASFVRKAADVLAIRKVIEDAGASIDVISKIESKEGLENLEEILKVSNGVMVARGDLGVEVPAEEVPLAQKDMIARCNRVGKPVITATQMLESMVSHPRPTRAEASDVANAILDGTDAVMLSAETAAGEFPTEAVRVMARIAERTEQALDYQSILARRAASPLRTVTAAISHATVHTAQDLGAAAIITPTQSGHTARMVSKYRPRSPIIAVTPEERVARRLALVWGVSAVVQPKTDSTDEMVDRAIEGALRTGQIKNGDLVVITAGVPVGIQGTTNLLRVHTVGDVMIRGTGIGPKAVTGRVCVARMVRDAEEKFSPGDILVAVATDRDFVPFMEKAAAVVTEEGGLTSHAAIVGINLGIPVVVGAEGATGILEDGLLVTVDGIRGLIYHGEARVL